jgi:hypothetical protein
VPAAMVALVMTGAAGEIVNVRVDVPVPPLLVALSATDEVPATVGVPEIRPVEGLTETPGDSPLAPKLVGEFVAVIWYENALPTVPVVFAALVITGGGLSRVINPPAPVRLSAVAFGVAPNVLEIKMLAEPSLVPEAIVAVTTATTPLLIVFGLVALPTQVTNPDPGEQLSDLPADINAVPAEILSDVMSLAGYESVH